MLENNKMVRMIQDAQMNSSRHGRRSSRLKSRGINRAIIKSSQRYQTPRKSEVRLPSIKRVRRNVSINSSKDSSMGKPNKGSLTTRDLKLRHSTSIKSAYKHLHPTKVKLPDSVNIRI